MTDTFQAAFDSGMAAYERGERYGPGFNPWPEFPTAWQRAFKRGYEQAEYYAKQEDD
jgi:hypothetical protein